MTDSDIRNERRGPNNGNGVIVPGWIVKLVLPILLVTLPALVTLSVDAQRDTARNTAILERIERNAVDACREVNELRQTLRELVLLAAQDEPPEERNTEEFLSRLQSQDCNG